MCLALKIFFREFTVMKYSFLNPVRGETNIYRSISNEIVSLSLDLKMNKLKFNYSYSRYTLAVNTSLFGLILNFQ